MALSQHTSNIRSTRPPCRLLQCDFILGGHREKSWAKKYRHSGKNKIIFIQNRCVQGLRCIARIGLVATLEDLADVCLKVIINNNKTPNFLQRKIVTYAAWRTLEIASNSPHFVQIRRAILSFLDSLTGSAVDQGFDYGRLIVALDEVWRSLADEPFVDIVLHRLRAGLILRNGDWTHYYRRRGQLKIDRSIVNH